MSGKVCKDIVFNLGTLTSGNMDPKKMEIEAEFDGVAAYDEFMDGVAL